MKSISLRARKSWILCTAGVGLTVLLSAPAAAAPKSDQDVQARATRAQLVLDCLRDGYVPGGVIERAFAKADSKTYTLDCGNSSYGVIHIDQGHPIPRTLTGAGQFVQCFVRLIQEGSKSAGSSGTTRWDYYQGLTDVAGGYTQNADLKVNTMFTLGSNSANWARCVQ